MVGSGGGGGGGGGGVGGGGGGGGGGSVVELVMVVEVLEDVDMVVASQWACFICGARAIDNIGRNGQVKYSSLAYVFRSEYVLVYTIFDWNDEWAKGTFYKS